MSFWLTSWNSVLGAGFAVSLCSGHTSFCGKYRTLRDMIGCSCWWWTRMEFWVGIQVIKWLIIRKYFSVLKACFPEKDPNCPGIWMLSDDKDPLTYLHESIAMAMLCRKEDRFMSGEIPVLVLVLPVSSCMIMDESLNLFWCKFTKL